MSKVRILHVGHFMRAVVNLNADSQIQMFAKCSNFNVDITVSNGVSWELRNR